MRILPTICMGCCRTDWRRLNAILGATLVTSSPRMSTASECSTSRNDGERQGPVRKISSMAQNQAVLIIVDAGVKPVRTNQGTQEEVRLERRPGRTDPNYLLPLGNQRRQMTDRLRPS